MRIPAKGLGKTTLAWERPGFPLSRAYCWCRSQKNVASLALSTRPGTRYHIALAVRGNNNKNVIVPAALIPHHSPARYASTSPLLFLPPRVLERHGGGGRIENQEATAADGEGAPTARIGRSGGDLQDAVEGGAIGGPLVPGGGVVVTPYFWLGGLSTGPLCTLLAAAGVPLGVVAVAWPGLPGSSRGASTAGANDTAHGVVSWGGVPAVASLAAGAWPDLVPAGSAGTPSHGGGLN